MSQQSNATDTEATRNSMAQRARLAQWGSIAALAISAFALAIGAYQTRLMQTQARASVWPYVVIGYSYSDGGDRPGFDLHVENNGVGPAIVRSVQVRLDDKPVQHWTDVLGALVGRGMTVQARFAGLSGSVIPPSTNRETAVSAMYVADAAVAKLFYHSVDRLAIDICYCSIYDDCWVTHWRSPRSEPVGACHESDHEFDY
jgi:hypothetical protein